MNRSQRRALKREVSTEASQVLEEIKTVTNEYVTYLRERERRLGG